MAFEVLVDWSTDENAEEKSLLLDEGGRKPAAANNFVSAITLLTSSTRTACVQCWEIEPLATADRVRITSWTTSVEIGRSARQELGMSVP